MTDAVTPTELARMTGLDRRDVISKCMEIGVPIFRGRIDPALFLESLQRDYPAGFFAALSDDRAAHFVLFDSSGNMIDSFDSAADVARAARRIASAEEGNREHFCLVVYDADGNVIDPHARTGVSAGI